MTKENREMFTKMRNTYRNNLQSRPTYGNQYDNNAGSRQTNAATTITSNNLASNNSSETSPNCNVTLSVTFASMAHRQNLQRRIMENHTHSGSTAAVAYLDSDSNTTALGGDAWIIACTTDRKVTISGYDQQTNQDNVRIGSRITATTLPNGKTVLLRAHESTLLGTSGNTLLSEQQITRSGVHLGHSDQGYKYMEIDDIVVPFIVKEAMYSLDIHRPTQTELQQCTIYELTSDLPWNPEEIQDKVMDSLAYDHLYGELELEEN